MKGKKGSIFTDYPIWLIIGIAVAVLMIVIYGIYSGWLEGVRESINNFFTFRRT